MKLYRVIVPVTEIGRAARFYEALFETEGERVSPGRHYFQTGGVILALYDPAADGDDAGLLGEVAWRHHPNQYLYFATGNLEAALERLQQAGGEVDRGIAEMPWGERLFYARDPFGTPICFVDDKTLFTGGAG